MSAFFATIAFAAMAIAMVGGITLISGLDPEAISTGISVVRGN